MRKFVFALFLCCLVLLSSSQSLDNDPRLAGVPKELLEKKKDLEILREEIRESQEKMLKLKSDGKDDEADALQQNIKEKMDAYHRLRGQVPPHLLHDLPRPGDESGQLENPKQDRHRRKPPPIHAGRAEMEKYQFERHKEFLERRKDDFLARIDKDGFEPDEAAALKKDVLDLHEMEVDMVEGRLQITLDFEGTKDIQDKDKLKEHLETTQKRREEQREKDMRNRERVTALLQKIEQALNNKERVELRV